MASPGFLAGKTITHKYRWYSLYTHNVLWYINYIETNLHCWNIYYAKQAILIYPTISLQFQYYATFLNLYMIFFFWKSICACVYICFSLLLPRERETEAEQQATLQSDCPGSPSPDRRHSTPSVLRCTLPGHRLEPFPMWSTLPKPDMFLIRCLHNLVECSFGDWLQPRYTLEMVFGATLTHC